MAATLWVASTSNSQPESARALDLDLPHASDTLIVGLRPDAEAARSFAMKLSETFVSVVHLDSLGLLIVRLHPGGDGALRSAVEKIPSSDLVSFVQPSYRLSIDYQMANSDSEEVDQWALARIEAVAAQNLIVNAKPVVVAVLDTGTATDHPDLSPTLWHNPCEACGNGADDSCVDGRKNGFVDDGHGWNFVNADDKLADVAGHGTNVAGVIAAVPGNGVCIDGVSQHVELMTLKAIANNKTEIDEAEILPALEYLLDEGVRVLNVSWSLGEATLAMGVAFQALAAHGVLVVAAAGAEDFPCNDAFPNIVCVGPTAEEDDEPIGDSWDHEKVHLGAPGESIRTTIPAVAGIDCALRSHSSIATPHVTGVAALILAKCPDASLDELIRRIVQCTDPVESLDGKTISGGRLNARRALEGLCGAVPSGCTQPYKAAGSTPK